MVSIFSDEASELIVHWLDELGSSQAYDGEAGLQAARVLLEAGRGDEVRRMSMFSAENGVKYFQAGRYCLALSFLRESAMLIDLLNRAISCGDVVAPRDWMWSPTQLAALDRQEDHYAGIGGR